jgi:DNA-binding response OmpR family regulator
MYKVLLVEDDIQFRDVMSDWLAAHNYVVQTAHDGEEAIELLQFYQYDVIILDWQLPKGSGVEVCQHYRSSGGMAPVLMLTAKSNVVDKEEGLDAGADDYLTKPFHLKELLARLRALLRRPASLTGNVLHAAHVSLDPTNHKVTCAGKDVQLQPLEFALLQFFLRHPNQVFNSEAILNRVWGNESDASVDTLRTYIKTLRKKIDLPGQDSLIKTVHGVGYLLESPK